MTKIDFVNGQEPALSAENLNALQTNVENGITSGVADGIEEATKTTYSTGNNVAYSCNYINNINTYSTSEKRAGTWIDGKPLYVMSVDFGSMPNNGRKTITTTIPTTARAKKITGICERYANNLHDSRPLEISASLILYRSENKEIFIDTSTDMSAWSAIVTIYYTKTTD